jgi:hypothetical protein
VVVVVRTMIDFIAHLPIAKQTPAHQTLGFKNAQASVNRDQITQVPIEAAMEFFRAKRAVPMREFF